MIVKPDGLGQAAAEHPAKGLCPRCYTPGHEGWGDDAGPPFVRRLRGLRAVDIEVTSGDLRPIRDAIVQYLAETRRWVSSEHANSMVRMAAPSDLFGEELEESLPCSGASTKSRTTPAGLSAGRSPPTPFSAPINKADYRLGGWLITPLSWKAHDQHADLSHLHANCLNYVSTLIRVLWKRSLAQRESMGEGKNRSASSPGQLRCRKSG
jgi:hypothetical protein